METEKRKRERLAETQMSRPFRGQEKVKQNATETKHISKKRNRQKQIT